MTSSMRIPILVLVLVINLALGPNLWAAGYCDHLLRLDPKALASLRPGTPSKRQYTKMIPLTPIRDQCQYGGCWVYANIGELESAIKFNHRKEIDLSEQYHLAQSLRLRALDALRYPGQQVSQGGVISEAYWLVENFGLVPAAAWKPRVPFEDSEHATRLMYFLNSRIAQFHLEAEAITDRAEMDRLWDQAEKEVLELIEVYTGPLPREAAPGQPAIDFEFEGRKFTPLSFRDHYLPKAPGKVTLLFPRRATLPPVLRQVVSERRPVYSASNPATIAPEMWENYRYQDLEEIKKDLIKRLTRSPDNPSPQPVWIAVEWVSTFVDKKTGIMSVDAFHTPEGFKPPLAAYRQSFGPSGGGHAVDIVDYELNADGTPKTFLIRNSWNVTSGDAGYYHMDVKGYFDHFFKYTYVMEPATAATALKAVLPPAATPGPILASSPEYPQALGKYLRNNLGTDYLALEKHLIKQRNGASCSLASVTMIVNAARKGKTPLTQDDILRLSNSSIWKDACAENGDGMQLDQLGKVLKEILPRLGMKGAQIEVAHVTDTSPAAKALFRHKLILNEASAEDFIILNFDQEKYLAGAGPAAGHYSPLGGFDSVTDQVLVLDPDPEVDGPYFASLQTVMNGMSTRDDASGKVRGYIRITLPEEGVKPSGKNP